MRVFDPTLARAGVAAGLALSAAVLWSTGCGSGNATLRLIGPLFPLAGEDGADQGPTGVGSGSGGGLGGGARADVDPCDESQGRKFVRLSLRNAAQDDFIHYFLVMIAFVNSETYPEGAVCVDDVDLYTEFGYTEIPEGGEREFGTYCIQGPALLYFHRGGQFQGTGGSLAAAIAPAQGASPTFDNFFNSGGAQVPVPDLILFHNPGTGPGAALQISDIITNPCAAVAFQADSECQQDAFYYVDENDLLSGSTALGFGSGRRVPSEIQGTGCECLGFEDASWQLAPSGTSVSDARCNEFLRGGRIDVVFLREDTDPPFPQAVWRVTDSGGSLVHQFDTRAAIP